MRVTGGTNMKKHIENKDLNRIEKRAIEALAIVPIIRAVTQRIGMDSALAILREVNRDVEQVYIIAHDGKVWPRSKNFGPAYLGFCCVR
jgi:hypothetical protein